MRLATWNINSVRLRIGLIERLLEEHKPEVLCLQETKTPDEFFPHENFEKLGYKYRHVCGMKGYNGVAILARQPFTLPSVRHWCEKEDCRHVHVKLHEGTELHCVYVPAGGDIPNPKENVKFRHKLQFLDELTEWWQENPRAKQRILVGDLNVAPLENDVWSHKQMLGVVSHTPVEVEKLKALQKSFAGADAVRHFVPESQKLYSWWSYRAADWKASDRGRRLDHIWASPSLVPSLTRMTILKDARGWSPKPSDHVPVMVDFN